jgi:hypothetical protein
MFSHDIPTLHETTTWFYSHHSDLNIMPLYIYTPTNSRLAGSCPGGHARVPLAAHRWLLATPSSTHFGCLLSSLFKAPRHDKVAMDIPVSSSVLICEVIH